MSSRKPSEEQMDIINACRLASEKCLVLGNKANDKNLYILARELWSIAKQINDACDLQLRNFRDDTLLNP